MPNCNPIHDGPPDTDRRIRRIYVNGRFLGRPMTGVERFAVMVLEQVDTLLNLDPPSHEHWTLLVPDGVERPAWWHQDFETLGKRHGHLWEQWNLARRAKDGILINLCNSGPLAPRRALTVIHDAGPYDIPQNYRPAYRLLHQSLGRVLAKRSRIATVSAFSRGRLAERLHIPPDSIAIIPNAADHCEHIAPQDGIIDRLDLRERPFLLFVGSFAPNKNLRTVLDAFARLTVDAELLILVGASGKSFAASGIPDIPANVILPGRIDDGELMALYRHACSLVFASTYEGFGIPLLEAFQLGCPVIASDIATSREVCRDAAPYFAPHDAAALAGLMRSALDDPNRREIMRSATREAASRFSWANSAKALRNEIDAIA